jgi:hypothetical protein
MNNCGPHGTDFNDNQVNIFRLPPNCTSVYEPMDAGIVAAIKRKYRGELLLRTVTTLRDIGTRRASARGKRAGAKDLNDGFHATFCAAYRYS